MKRPGRSAHSDGLPTIPTATLEHQLEKQIEELKEQLRRQEIQNILDLQIASGMTAEKERNESAERLAKIPADALEIVKAQVVKVLSRLNNVTAPPSPSRESTHGDEPYIV